MIKYRRRIHWGKRYLPDTTCSRCHLLLLYCNWTIEPRKEHQVAPQKSRAPWYVTLLGLISGCSPTRLTYYTSPVYKIITLLRKVHFLSSLLLWLILVENLTGSGINCKASHWVHLGEDFLIRSCEMGRLTLNGSSTFWWQLRYRQEEECTESLLFAFTLAGKFTCPVCTEDLPLSRSPPGHQCQIGTAEASSLVDRVTVSTSPVWGSRY